MRLGVDHDRCAHDWRVPLESLNNPQRQLHTQSVTVVIPTLNRPELCRVAVGSVLDQVGVECLVLISENASDDVYVQAYCDLFGSLPDRVRVLRHAQRMAVEQHLPYLLGLVETKYVVLLADDDRLTPSFIARALQVAEASAAGSVFGSYCLDNLANGTTSIRDIDHSASSSLLQVMRFITRRDDGFIYGLHRTEVLRSSMAYFKPFQIFGRRALMNVAFAPLMACLLAAPYRHLAGEPVLRYQVDSVKSEPYLGEHRARKLLELISCEVILVGRFLRIASVGGGPKAVLLVAPLATGMACWHCVKYLALAARRVMLMALSLGRRAMPSGGGSR